MGGAPLGPLQLFQPTTCKVRTFAGRTQIAAASLGLTLPCTATDCLGLCQGQECGLRAPSGFFLLLLTPTSSSLDTPRG